LRASRRRARMVVGSVPGARPSPRSIRPGCRLASVPYCSAMISGAWFGSITPPAPGGMLLVCAATCAISTLVAEEAIEGLLWCSAYQTRSYPHRSAAWARATVPASPSCTVCSRPTTARSSRESTGGMVWGLLEKRHGRRVYLPPQATPSSAGRFPTETPRQNRSRCTVRRSTDEPAAPRRYPARRSDTAEHDPMQQVSTESIHAGVGPEVGRGSGRGWGGGSGPGALGPEAAGGEQLGHALFEQVRLQQHVQQRVPAADHLRAGVGGAEPGLVHTDLRRVGDRTDHLQPLLHIGRRQQLGAQPLRER